MNHLLPGDLVIADREFTGKNMAYAEVKIPPFTKRKKQLEKSEVDWGHELSAVYGSMLRE